MNSENGLLSFLGAVLFFSVSQLWTDVTDASGACTWRGGVGLF